MNKKCLLQKLYLIYCSVFMQYTLCKIKNMVRNYDKFLFYLLTTPDRFANSNFKFVLGLK